MIEKITNIRGFFVSMTATGFRLDMYYIKNR